jgi:protein-tyrosine phosphatase
MRELIRWYRDSPPRLRVVFRAESGRAPSSSQAEPPPRRGRKRLLVVCFGNVCRSPFAAGLLDQLLDRGQWQVLSAGTDAVDGKPVSTAMRVAAAEFGVDLSRHRSHEVTRELLRTSDLVITMSQRQAAKLLEIEPTIRRRIRLLGGFDPQPNTWGLPADPRKPAAGDDEIPDPSGEDFEFHRLCCRRLDRAVTQLSRWVLRREASRPLPAPRPPLSAPTLRAARLR